MHLFAAAHRSRCVLAFVLSVAAILARPTALAGQAMTVTGAPYAQLLSRNDDVGYSTYEVYFTIKNTGAQSAYAMSQGNCGPFVQPWTEACPDASWHNNGLIAPGASVYASVQLYVSDEYAPASGT